MSSVTPVLTVTVSAPLPPKIVSIAVFVTFENDLVISRRRLSRNQHRPARPASHRQHHHRSCRDPNRPTPCLITAVVSNDTAVVASVTIQEVVSTRPKQCVDYNVVTKQMCTSPVSPVTVIDTACGGTYISIIVRNCVRETVSAKEIRIGRIPDAPVSQIRHRTIGRWSDNRELC